MATPLCLPIAGTLARCVQPYAKFGGGGGGGQVTHDKVPIQPASVMEMSEVKAKVIQPEEQVSVPGLVVPVNGLPAI